MGPEELDATPPHTVAVHHAAVPAARSLCVIVIEDEPLVALSIKDTVEELGHSVCGLARSESEAVDIVRAKRPDLALMDAHLPGAADGIEVARRLNATFGIRTVFLAGNSDHATMARITSSYPLGVVSKPFSRAQLRTTLDLAARRLRMPPVPAGEASRVTPE
jgi:two-component system, response regulator PdtaR